MHACFELSLLVLKVIIDIFPIAHLATLKKIPLNFTALTTATAFSRIFKEFPYILLPLKYKIEMN